MFYEAKLFEVGNDNYNNNNNNNNSNSNNNNNNNNNKNNNNSNVGYKRTMKCHWFILPLYKKVLLCPPTTIST